jgi:hypothetical protein
MKQNIQPKPKWYFRLRNSIFWTIFWLSLCFGSLATTMIIYSVHELGFSLVPTSILQYTFLVLPFYWVLLFIVFSIVALLGFQKTKQGYKISLLSLVFCNVGASLFLGANIYFWGGVDILDYTVDNLAISYQSLEQQKMILWDRPRQGLLSGTVIAVKDNRYWIKSFRNQIWELQLPKDIFKPIIGSSVRIKGSMIDSRLFDVETLAYWHVDPWNRLHFKPERPRIRPHFVQPHINFPQENDLDVLQKMLDLPE